jgi:hypothetical protein
VDLQVGISVSKEHTTSIFSPEDGDSMFLEKVVSACKSTLRHNPVVQHQQTLISLNISIVLCDCFVDVCLESESLYFTFAVLRVCVQYV